MCQIRPVWSYLPPAMMQVKGRLMRKAMGLLIPNAWEGRLAGATMVRTALLVALALTVLVFSSQASAGPPEPTLRLDVPKQVAVGEPIELTLKARDVADIAGYETILLFDTSAAHFSGLQQRKKDLKKLGRDVGSLGA